MSGLFCLVLFVLSRQHDACDNNNIDNAYKDNVDNDTNNDNVDDDDDGDDVTQLLNCKSNCRPFHVFKYLEHKFLHASQ